LATPVVFIHYCGTPGPGQTGPREDRARADRAPGRPGPGRPGRENCSGRQQGSAGGSGTVAVARSAAAALCGSCGRPRDPRMYTSTSPAGRKIGPRTPAAGLVPAAFKEVVLPRGSPREGPTVIFPRRSWIWGRFRPGSYVKPTFYFYFGLTRSWALLVYILGARGRLESRAARLGNVYLYTNLLHVTQYLVLPGRRSGFRCECAV
jgi:hypothetical protein